MKIILRTVLALLLSILGVGWLVIMIVLLFTPISYQNMDQTTGNTLLVLLVAVIGITILTLGFAVYKLIGELKDTKVLLIQMFVLVIMWATLGFVNTADGIVAVFYEVTAGLLLVTAGYMAAVME